MLDGFQPVIQFAIMSILSALYESGTVEEVNLADIMRLFGIQPSNDDIMIVSFSDQGWIESYIDFRETAFEQEDIKLAEFEMEETSDDFNEIETGAMPADKKLH